MLLFELHIVVQYYACYGFLRPSAWILISLKTPGKIYRNKSLKNFYLEIIYGLKFGPFSSSAILLSSEIDSSLLDVP